MGGDDDTPVLAMDEFSQELEETKREIAEIRGLVIKTNNLVNCLSADMKNIGKRQDSYERRIWVNSTAAFLVTIAVLLVLGKVAWDFRVAAIVAQTEGTQKDLAAASAKLNEIIDEQQQATRARAQAAVFYELVRGKRAREIVEGYPDIAKLPLSPAEKAVFADAFRESKHGLSRSSYHRGLDHTRMGRWHEAQEAFSESLSTETNAPHSSQARFQLARSLKELGRPKEAVVILDTLSTAAADQEVMDDATFLLAMTQIDLEAWDDAKGTLRSFIRRFPKSRKRGLAKLRLAELKIHH